MKHLFSILTVFLLCAGCNEDKDVLPDQQSKYVSYLKSTHVPKLLSEQEKSQSVEKDPEYYITTGETVYRYIRHFYNAERLQRPRVEYGDELSLTFWMYEFGYKNITIYGRSMTMPYYTNDEKLADTLYNYGLTPGAWEFEPLVVNLGSTEILEGLELALPGCRELDTVEIFMTYNMAYGKNPVGVVPKQSPIAVFVTVDKVTKN